MTDQESVCFSQALQCKCYQTLPLTCKNFLSVKKACNLTLFRSIERTTTLTTKLTCRRSSRGKFLCDAQCKCKRKRQTAQLMMSVTRSLRGIMPAIASKHLMHYSPTYSRISNKRTVRLLFFPRKIQPSAFISQMLNSITVSFEPCAFIIFRKNTLPFTLIPYFTFIRYSRLLTFLKVLTFKLASRKFRPTFSMPQLLDSSDWNLICKSLTDSYFSRVHYTEYLCNLVFRQNVDPVSLLDIPSSFNF